MPYPRTVVYSLAPVATGSPGGGVLTVTDRGEDLALAATITSHYSGAVPTANCYLVTVFGGWDTSNVGTPPTVSDNFADTGGGAWQYVFDQLHNFGTATPHIRCAWRKYGTGGISGREITVTGWSGTPDYLQMGVWEVSGANSTSPIKQYINAETSLTTLTNTLPAALATTNSMVITGKEPVIVDTGTASAGDMAGRERGCLWIVRQHDGAVGRADR